MSRAHRDVVITGLGAVSALAPDCPGLWEALAQGRGGIEPIRRFSTEGFAVGTGALVKACAEVQPGSRAVTEALCRRFAHDAFREAVRGAGLDVADHQGMRVGVVFGTGLGHMEPGIHVLAEELATAHGFDGPRLTVSTACSSSTAALGLARDLIAMDAADVVIAGGADVLSPDVFAGFHALGVLTAGKCAPFSLPFGTTLGEGAGFVVLERGDAARRRGVAVRAVLSGYGLAADAFHETSPDPRGAGVERAIRGALGDAALGAELIGYVNAHGSGTEANDPSEWRGIRRGLGPHAEAIPLSSTKGALGHAQGAAGVLEAIVTILSLAHGVVPPTLNFVAPRPHAPPDPVPGRALRPWVCHHALSLNSAFGGANAALVLSHPNGSRGARERKAVYVLGVGVAGAAGPPLEPLVPAADTRGLDPTSRFITAAAAVALRDGGVSLHGVLCARTGLLLGQRRASPASTSAFDRSIAERGLRELSATAFARIVLNAAAGSCSKLLALRGPLSAITTGPSSGLAAIVFAAELLSTREDVVLMVSGGVDESAPGESPEPAAEAEGAACLLLGDVEGMAAAPQAAAIRLAGWGIAGAGQVELALARALVMADEDARTPAVEFRAAADDGTAAGSVRAAAAAVEALRRGDVDRAVVLADEGCSLSAALVLAR